MERSTVDETLSTLESQVRTRGVPIAMVAVVEYMDEQGELNLLFIRDTTSAIWKHIGMLTSGLDDCRQAMQLSEEES